MHRTVYLDIETSWAGAVTVVGMHWPGRETRQLVGGEITAGNLLEALGPARLLKTYNGDRFDLPVIRQRLGLDLKILFEHDDLMYRCWKQKLKGGLKSVERQLGICRETHGVDGLQAMHLWAAWEQRQDRAALDLLLKYNREDIELLAEVERRLARRESGRETPTHS